MHGKTIYLAVAAAVSIGLAGCSESSDVKLYKPGVYKGSTDPLLEKQRSAEKQTALRERFELVQKDR